MQIDLSQIGIAFLFSLAVVLLALWRGWLSSSGAIGAMIVGTLTMGFGGWIWGILLGVFFVSSSALSHFKEDEKKAASEKFDKGSKRDIMQAFANGGLGSIIAVCSAIWPSETWFWLFIGVMATVTADTWATELGTLSKRPPRLITTGRVVEVGISGGVSPLGTAVSFLGGALIGLVAGLFTGLGSAWLYVFAAGLGGLAGSLFDSLLGATVQRIYWDDLKQKETEKRFKYGREMKPLRGWGWMNNDLVNLLASVIGGLVVAVVGLVLLN
jgi:uncharacterized protein (TIGR00297 family)